MAKQKYTKRLSTTENGVTKEISVNEVENGFIVEVYKSWEDKEKGYQSECKKFIYDYNPLEGKPKIEKDDPAKSEIADLQKYFSTLMDFGGGLNL